MSEPEKQTDAPHLKTVEAAIVHLNEGDILVCSVSNDVIEQIGYERLAVQIRQLVGNTGRKNIGFVVVPEGDVSFDVIKSDREIGQLRTEVAELKTQVAKLLK